MLPVAIIDFPIISVFQLAQNPIWSQASGTKKKNGYCEHGTCEQN